MSRQIAALRSTLNPTATTVADDAPDELTPDTFAARLYEMLAPVARTDFENAWSLLIYVNAIGQMFQLIEDLVRDTEDGPGWSILLDLDRCPDAALPWLAQFVGVRIPPGLSSADQRAYIASTAGFRRGTLAALRGAAAATLTGNKRVLITERSGDTAVVPDYAYHIDVSTYTSETPDAAKTLAALLAQKPGGLVLHYSVVPGQTWRQLQQSGRTWAQVKTAYTDWDNVRSDQPG